MSKISKILFPTDFSDISAKAAKETIDLCSTLGASLEVFHVVELNSMIAMYGRYAAILQETEFKALQSASKQMKDFVQKFNDQESVKINTKVVSGIAAPTVCDYAKEQGCNLIAMATHGRSGLPKFFLGSVTERVIRTSPVPVLVLKNSET